MQAAWGELVRRFIGVALFFKGGRHRRGGRRRRDEDDGGSSERQKDKQRDNSHVFIIYLFVLPRGPPLPSCLNVLFLCHVSAARPGSALAFTPV